MDTQQQIEEVCDNMKKFLIEKNIRYGDSALNPIDIFLHYINNEKDHAIINILVRLNDKINRIINSKELRQNDVIDLVGYLILLMIQKNWEDLNKFID